MSDSFHTDSGLIVRRVDTGPDGHYEVIARDTGEVLGTASWLSFGDTGMPVAVGDDGAELELGGTTPKTVEWVSNVELDDGTHSASGARIYFGD